MQRPRNSAQNRLFRLYPTSRRQELLAEGFFVFFIIYCILSIFRLQQLLSIVVPMAPSEDQNAFLMGLIWSPLFNIVFAGIIPLYATYRMGLIRYLVDQESRTVIAKAEIEAKTRNFDIQNPVTNKTRSDEDVNQVHKPLFIMDER